LTNPKKEQVYLEIPVEIYLEIQVEVYLEIFHQIKSHHLDYLVEDYLIFLKLIKKKKMKERERVKLKMKEMTI
jgi:hypothetical protein